MVQVFRRMNAMQYSSASIEARLSNTWKAADSGSRSCVKSRGCITRRLRLAMRPVAGLWLAFGFHGVWAELRMLLLKCRWPTSRQQSTIRNYTGAPGGFNDRSRQTASTAPVPEKLDLGAWSNWDSLPGLR